MRPSLDRISVVMFSGNTVRKYVLDSIHSCSALSTWTTRFKSWVYPYNPKLCLWIFCWHTLNFTAESFSASKQQKWDRHIFMHATQKEMGETSFYPSLIWFSNCKAPTYCPYFIFVCVCVCNWISVLCTVAFVALIDAKYKFGHQFWVNGKGLAYSTMPHSLFLMRNCMHFFSIFASLFCL